MRIIEVFDEVGSQLGLIYLDSFKRDNKAGGARMGNLVPRSKLPGTKPVIYNVANFHQASPVGSTNVEYIR